MKNVQKLFRIIYSSLVVIILILLLINVLSLRGQQGFSELYITFYTWLLLAGIVLGVVFLFMDFFNAAFTNNEYASFGFLYEKSRFRLLTYHPVLRYGAVVLFTVVVVMTATVGKIQIFPTPEPFASGFAPTEWQRAYYMSVPVGIAEDFIFNFVSPITFTALLMALFWLFTRRRLEAGRMEDILLYFIFTVMAGLMAAYVFMITHGNSYQANTAAYISAFIFSFMTCMLYLHTGFFFFAIPHILHNYLFAVGMVIATLNLGAVAPIFACVRLKWLEVSLKNQLQIQLKNRKCQPRSRSSSGLQELLHY